MRKPNKEFGEDKEQSYVSETSGFLAVSQNPQPSAMHQTLQLYPSTQFWLNLAVVAQDIQKRDHETPLTKKQSLQPATVENEAELNYRIVLHAAARFQILSLANTCTIFP